MAGWDRLSLDGTDYPMACDWPWKLLGDCLPPRLGMGHLVGHVWPRPPSADNGASRLTAAVVDRLNAALEGRYAIERELGEGGMATVYLAADLEYGRKVALKPETRESIPDFPGQRQRSRVGAGRVGGILSRRRRPVACGAGGRQRPRAPHALRGELGYSLPRASSGIQLGRAAGRRVVRVRPEPRGWNWRRRTLHPERARGGGRELVRGVEGAGGKLMRQS